MQNRYVGDVGDFGNFGLLKAVLAGDDGGSPLTLGVNWFLHENEDHTNDGKHVTYLEPSARNDRHYRACDPALYETLREIVTTGRRHVVSIRESGILPPETVYYEEPLHDFDFREGSPMALQSRQLRRRAWFQQSLRVLGGQDLIYLEPDNGLAPEGMLPSHPKAGKYVFPEEVRQSFEGFPCLCLYQHVTRHGTTEEQYRLRLEQLRGLLDDPEELFGIVYRRGSRRFWFFAGRGEYASLLRPRVRSLMETPWQQHFLWME